LWKRRGRTELASRKTRALIILLSSKRMKTAEKKFKHKEGTFAERSRGKK